MTSNSSLGALLEAARQSSGMTLNGLSQSTGIPLTSLHRLFHDQVARPSPAHLVTLADALGIARGPLLAAAGYPAQGGADSIETALRAAYTVPDEAIAQMRAAIETVAAQYADTTGTGEAQ